MLPALSPPSSWGTTGPWIPAKGAAEAGNDVFELADSRLRGNDVFELANCLSGRHKRRHGQATQRGPAATAVVAAGSGAVAARLVGRGSAARRSARLRAKPGDRSCAASARRMSPMWW